MTGGNRPHRGRGRAERWQRPHAYAAIALASLGAWAAVIALAQLVF